MIDWLIGLLFPEPRPSTDWRTPSGRFCPYRGMTDDELDDFETWARNLGIGS